MKNNSCKLEDIFKNVSLKTRINWDSEKKFKKITADSRSVEEGDIFVACQGTRMDGHDFLGQAMQAKASLVVFERDPETSIPEQVTAVKVEDAKASLSLIINNFYGHPDKDLKLIGVTGTNGKTTITYLLHHLLREKMGAACIGTLWYELPSGKIVSPNTTPGPETLIPLLNQMREEGIEYCAMEVSSHALSQKRIYGLELELAIFTQLTRDHLDYHHNMERYYQTKRTLFDRTPAPKNMLINADCPYGKRLIEEWEGARKYSILESADYNATKMEFTFKGTRFQLNHNKKSVPFHLRLPMHYNVSNVVAVLGALDLLGFCIADFKEALAEISCIPGRMERVGNGEDFLVFVDYAHTSDAVEQVLHDVRELRPKRILTLFGCGGDRDHGKRAEMASSACRYSDIVMITSDNPRSEDPKMIVDDITKGIPKNPSREIEIHEELDRETAIAKLIALANPGDVILILGKGHEDYQILGDEKIPFSDHRIIENCLKRKSRVSLS